MLQCGEFIAPCCDNITHTPTQTRLNTRASEMQLLYLLRQHQMTSGRRWQMLKIDELEAKGCIPLNIFRKHSDFPQFGPHKTLWQPIWSSYWVVVNLNEHTPADASIPMFWLADWPQWYLKPRLRWHQSGEATERKWRCHRSGFVNWWDALNEEKASATFWKLVKPEQTY